MIDAGLAADGGIHLRQQRGRQLHESDAALVAGRRKPGQVADHAAAERQHQASRRSGWPPARPARATRSPASCTARHPAARTSTMRPPRSEACTRASAYSGADRGVADQQQVARGMCRDKRAASPSSRADQDRIGAFGELTTWSCLHGKPARARLSRYTAQGAARAARRRTCSATTPTLRLSVGR